MGWALSHTYLGQTFTLLFFGATAVMGALAGLLWVHRLVPITFFAALALFTPYGAVASRALIAAPALQGFATGFNGPLLGWLQGLMLVVGLIEVYGVFQ